MITVEIRGAGKAALGEAEVELYCDQAGLTRLLKQLQHLQNGSTHVHLMTPAWAGNELGEKPFGAGTELINHLRITLVQTEASDRKA